jgi:predicted PurR-regulated permease PerM
MAFFGVGLAFVAGAALAWAAIDGLLLLFGAILLGIFLYELASRASRASGMPHGVALGLIVTVGLVLAGLGVWTGAGLIVKQFSELLKILPFAVYRIQEYFGDSVLLRPLAPQVPAPDQVLERLSDLMPQAGVFFTGVFGILTNIAVLVIVAVYLAAQPNVYRHGLMMLMPPRKRKRSGEVLDELTATLGQWLMGKAVSMLVVSVVTTLGLLLLEMPLALVLGLIAGLLDFIPYVGPILAGVPAVLIASTMSPALVGYVLLLFLVIQAAEGYLLMPLIEHKSVSLPPALTISMQVILGSLFGLTGVALATPLVAVVMVLITMLYVQDVLRVPASTPSTRVEPLQTPAEPGTG